MNKSSFICNLINSNPNNWEDICTEKKIKIRKEPPYAIFNYDIGADFSDPVVQEARGIIINIEEKEVACFPFRKFGNFHEPYADKIDWSTAKVQEKVDGSIVKLWYDHQNNKWRFSSNSCIDASQAMLSSGYSILDLIHQTKEYTDIKHAVSNTPEALNKDTTYIFELVGPDNQVVIQYPEPKLYHIGTRSNKTGQEFSINVLGLPQPLIYPLHSLKDCISTAKILNKAEYPDAEGFVVVDAAFHRIKIKTPEYLICHKAIGNGQITASSVWELINLDDFNLQTFTAGTPEHISNKIIEYIDIFKELEKDIFKTIDMFRDSYDQGMSRKEIALKYKENPLSIYGFKGLDNNDSPKEILQSIKDQRFIKIAQEIYDSTHSLDKNVEEKQEEIEI